MRCEKQETYVRIYLSKKMTQRAMVNDSDNKTSRPFNNV